MMHIIDPTKLRAYVTDIFLCLKIDATKAALLADSLVMADLWGHSSHGVLRTSWYGTRIRNKVMDPRAEIEVLMDTGPLLALDGHNGIGQHITNEAVHILSERAKQYGTACATIRRSGHFGTAMYFTKILADQNMIGFLATNASPAMAPYGGVEKMVGNNPQSWAAPTNSEAPFILDISHTAVARGKIYLAKDKNEPIPDHWAVSKDGIPTTDPSEAIEGTLLPMAGHKGFGLSAMMDVLSGILSNSSFGTAVNGPYVPDKPSGVGHFLFAIDIGKIRDISDFKADMDEMITNWKQSQHAAGYSDIYYPGEKEHLHFQQTKADGLHLPEDTIANLIAFADSCGLAITLADLTGD